MKRYLVFLLSLFLSLAVMLIPWGLFVFVEEEEEEADLSLNAGFSDTVLISMKDKEGPLFYGIFTLSHENISFCLFPPETLVYDMGDIKTLTRTEKNGGIKYCLKALNETYGLNILRYSSLSLKEWEKLLSPFGKFDFTFKEEILSLNGFPLFKKERQLTDAEKMLLLFSPSAKLDKSERIKIFSSMLKEILNQKGKLSLYEKEEIFNIPANSLYSDFSINDKLRWEKLNLFDEGFTCGEKILQGSYSDDKKAFLPAF